MRFGSFELDQASGELRKNGGRVRLQEQPFQVLRALVERPGEVVTREDLHERLWPGDTFVEFDDGLNTAVRKIRQALGDSADNPRFVETLPRRGYRFIAPLDRPSDQLGTGGPTPGRSRRDAGNAQTRACKEAHRMARGGRRDGPRRTALVGIFRPFRHHGARRGHDHGPPHELPGDGKIPELVTGRRTGGFRLGRREPG